MDVSETKLTKNIFQMTTNSIRLSRIFDDKISNNL